MSHAQDQKKVDSLTARLRKAERSGNDSLIAASIAPLAMEYWVNQPELSLKLSQRQLEIAKKIDFKWAIAQAYNLQGGIYDYKGEYDKALELYKKAIVAYDELPRKSDLVDVYNSIGIVYARQGIYSEGLKYMLKALKLAMDVQYNPGIVATYNNIGTVYESQKQYDQSLKYYFSCLDMQRKHKVGYEHATLGNIGSLYLLKEQPALAVKYYQQGIQDAIEEDDKPSLANNYAGLGKAYAFLHEWDKSNDYHTKALDIRTAMDDTFGLKSSYLSIGENFYKIRDYNKALGFVEKASRLIDKDGELPYRVQLHTLLSDIYAAAGKYKQGYDHLKLFKQYNDSLFNADNTRKLTEQQMNFDFKLKEEKKDAEARQALSRQKDIRNYAIAGVLVIAIFTFVLLRQRHRFATIKKQKAHEAAMQKAASDMAMRELAHKAETENSRLKEEQMKERLQFNQRELASATLNLYQKNELLSGLRKEIDALPAVTSNPGQFEKIRSALQSEYYAEADWERFRVHFEQVHPDFFKNLNEKHPTLTSYEVRLCAYLHLNMSTKEIAGLLNITPDSVTKAKMRLNKKLNQS